MKKIFTLLTASFFTLSAMAFDGSRLSISTVGKNKDIQVEVDGRRIQFRGNSVTLRNLNNGYHTIKIYRELRRNDRNDRYDRNDGWGNGNGFGRREILYNSSVLVRDGFYTDITINRFGRVFTDERRMDRFDDYFDNDEDDGGYYGGGGGNGGWNNGYPNVISARDFEQVKESLRKEWFENNRLTSAKFIIDNNMFTTAQVRELMQLFTFENNKLEIAKYAYRKTVDRQNYYQLNDALTFNSSKEELARFIRDFRQ